MIYCNLRTNKSAVLREPASLSFYSLLARHNLQHFDCEQTHNLQKCFKNQKTFIYAKKLYKCIGEEIRVKLKRNSLRLLFAGLSHGRFAAAIAAAAVHRHAAGPDAAVTAGAAAPRAATPAGAVIVAIAVVVAVAVAGDSAIA